jgi:hypothetical protein
MQGKGSYTYGDGSRYVGMFKNDKRDGYGVYTYSSGDKYSGEWKVCDMPVYVYVCMYSCMLRSGIHGMCFVRARRL